MFLRQLLPFGSPSTAAPGPPAIAPPAGARETCFRKLGLRQDGTPILVVNANADETSLERRWRRERFAGVIDRIAAAFPGIQILLTGVSREREYVEGLRMLCHTPVRNTAGELSLAEFAVLLEASAAVLSNDSGTVHLAAAVGTPTVSLFGPESPEYYGPLDGSTTLYAGVECSPCLNIYAAKRFVCPHAARCMESISVDETAGALLALLGKEMAHAGVA
jgi:ADP-heptose:LPS heptosyltransferase